MSKRGVWVVRKEEKGRVEVGKEKKEVGVLEGGW